MMDEDAGTGAIDHDITAIERPLKGGPRPDEFVIALTDS
jgi:hypothetical protein